ncbi:MAG TPA: hypothetical protein VIJ70_07745 [Gaiellaceae bacterium]
MDVSLARQQWHDGNRRVEETRSAPARYLDLTTRVDLVVAALRKRLGQSFTLGELSGAYDGADEWARSLLADADPDAPVISEPGTVADAAFHLFARGASDYSP